MVEGACHRRLGAAALALAWALAVPVAAAGPTSLGIDAVWSQGSGPIEVRAGSFTLDERKQRIVYDVDVVITRGTATLTCDRLTVEYDDDRTVTEVECAGDVRFVQDQRRARAERAKLDRTAGILTLTGDVRVDDGPNSVEGERVDVEIDVERVSVRGAPDRLACTRFVPGGEAAATAGTPSPQTVPDAPRAAVSQAAAAGAGDETPAGLGLPAGPDGLWGESEGPVDVCALSAVFSNRDGVLEYRGRVEARQAGAVLRCDVLELGYGDAGVERGECKGPVEVIRDDIVATADDAVFDDTSDRIAMVGSVRVWEEGAEIQAHRALVFMDQERVVFEGSGTELVETTIEAESAALGIGAEDDAGSASTDPIEDPFGLGDEGEIDPLRVRALWLQVDQGACNGLYRGDVVTRHRGVTMESDELEVGCVDDGAELERIEARKSVRISHAEGVATAETAVYTASDRKLVLRADPDDRANRDVVFDRPGQGRLACPEMVFDRIRNKMWCEGKGPTRPRLRLQTGAGADAGQPSLLPGTGP